MDTTPEQQPAADQTTAPQDLAEWLDLGIRMGWASQYFCDTHDAPPMTDDEEAAWEEGDDWCAFHVRVWFEGRPDVVNHGREHGSA